MVLGVKAERTIAIRDCVIFVLGEGWGMAVALASLGTGLIVGLIFTAFKLPLPAPPVFSGILGIFGIWAGSQIWPMIAGIFSK